MIRGSGWLSYDAASRRISLTVRVHPNARRDEIVGLYGDALKIKVAAPAVENRANAALVEFLGETLGVPRSAIVIRHGATGRRKVLEITGGPELVTKLAKLG
ncbi:MAG: DUF167 domain-containing protein [Burkholderiales bacterium]